MPYSFLEGNAGGAFCVLSKGLLRARRRSPDLACALGAGLPTSPPISTKRPTEGLLAPQPHLVINPTWSFWRPSGRVKCGVGRPSHSARFRRTAKSRHEKLSHKGHQGHKEKNWFLRHFQPFVSFVLFVATFFCEWFGLCSSPERTFGVSS